MFENIRKDLRRFHGVAYSRGDRLQDQHLAWGQRVEVIHIFWQSPGLKTLIVYRLGRWLCIARQNPWWWPTIPVLSPVYWIFKLYFRAAYDICLETSAEIGPGLFIGHFGGICIRNCRIGTNCSIQQEVCIGPTSEGNQGPTIGNRVWIGAHSKIQGRITVGDRATIGAGAKITSDVSEGCLMLGNPARLCQMNYDNSGFL